MGVITTLWKILGCIITLHEMYTRLCVLIHITLHSLSTTTWKVNMITTNDAIFIVLEGNKSTSYSYSFLSLMGSITTLWTVLGWIITIHEFFICLGFLLHTLSTTRHIIGNTNTNDANIAIANNDNLLGGELEVVMGKLGISYDPNGDDIGERVGKEDIEGLLEEEKMGLEYVREAFGVFDENCDGFIDANELEKVVCALGLMKFHKRCVKG